MTCRLCPGRKDARCCFGSGGDEAIRKCKIQLAGTFMRFVTVNTPSHCSWEAHCRSPEAGSSSLSCAASCRRTHACIAASLCHDAVRKWLHQALSTALSFYTLRRSQRLAVLGQLPDLSPKWQHAAPVATEKQGSNCRRICLGTKTGPPCGPTMLDDCLFMGLNCCAYVHAFI